MSNRIEEIKNEVAELFEKNKIKDGLIHATYKEYMDGERPKGYKPYVDSRIKFKGVKKLNKLINEFESIIKESN